MVAVVICFISDRKLLTSYNSVY